MELARGPLFAVCAGLVLVTASAPGSAHAQRTSLAILGLTSEEGDDERATDLTVALREQAESEAKVRLADTRASLSQMTMVQDCEIAEAACRMRVGKALSSDQVIYGSVRRAGARAHEVELHLFQTSDGSEVSAKRVIPASDTSDAQLSPHARALLGALRGEPEPSAVSRGDDGPMPIPTVTPDVQPLDEHESAGDDATAPPPDSVESSNDWFGYTLLGVAAVSAGLTVFSWTQIQSANDDVLGYREAVHDAGRRDEDVCPLAEREMAFGLDAQELDSVVDACGRGAMFETLQYVFIGAALVSAGVGTYFLVDDEADASAGSDFAVRAQVGPGRALVSLRLEL